MMTRLQDGIRRAFVGRRFASLMFPIAAAVAAGAAWWPAPTSGSALESATDARSAGANARTVLVADRMVAPDGTLRSNVAVTIDDDGRIGTIRGALMFAVPDGADVVELPPGTVLAPGLIDLAADWGVPALPAEAARVVEPDVEAADAFDRTDPHLDDAVAAGITATMLTPAPTSLVAGAAATMRTAVQDADGNGDPDIEPALRTDGPLVLALHSATWMLERAPSSRAGAVRMLRGLLRDAAEGTGPRPLVDLVADRHDAFVYLESIEDVIALRRLLEPRGIDVAVHVPSDHVDAAREMAGLDWPVVIGPFGPAADPADLFGAVALADAGLPLAIRGGGSGVDPRAMRTTAHLAVRYGLDAATARRALSAVPARIAGVEERVGEIRTGLDADLVLFSDDPLRPDARVLRVWAAGVPVHRHSRTGGN